MVGWKIIADNSCDINLMDAFYKKDIKQKLFKQYDANKERDDRVGK